MELARKGWITISDGSLSKDANRDLKAMSEAHTCSIRAKSAESRSDRLFWMGSRAMIGFPVSEMFEFALRNQRAAECPSLAILED